MRDLVTDLLDLAGLVLLALGLGALAAGSMLGSTWVGVGLGLAVTGLVLIAACRVIDWQTKPHRAPSWWPKPKRGET
jgi:membrane protein implicated in regulation of membrane protease activity